MGSPVTTPDQTIYTNRNISTGYILHARGYRHLVLQQCQRSVYGRYVEATTKEQYPDAAAQVVRR